jgi:DNA-binding beta-propeller fold protein YncE
MKSIRFLTAVCLSAAALSLLLAWASSSPAQAAAHRAAGEIKFTVVATITVGSQPHGVTVDSASNTIYVANHGSTVNGISVINGNSLAVVDHIYSEYASSLVYNPVDGRLYVGSNPDDPENRGSIWVISPTTKLREDPPEGMYHPGGGAVYTGTGTVYFVNHATCPTFNCVTPVRQNHLDNQGVTAQDYSHIAIDSGGNKYVVSHYTDSRRVTLVGNDNEEWTTYVDTGLAGLWDIAWDPVGDRLYATAMDAGKIAKVDRSSLANVEAIDPPVAASLAMVAVDPDERLLFVSEWQGSACSSNRGRLFIYNLEAGEWLTTTLTLGSNPDQGIAIDTGRKRLYVTNRCSNTLSVVSYGREYKVYLPLIVAEGAEESTSW